MNQLLVVKQDLDEMNKYNRAPDNSQGLWNSFHNYIKLWDKHFHQGCVILQQHYTVLTVVIKGFRFQFKSQSLCCTFPQLLSYQFRSGSHFNTERTVCMHPINVYLGCWNSQEKLTHWKTNKKKIWTTWQHLSLLTLFSRVNSEIAF